MDMNRLLPVVIAGLLVSSGAASCSSSASQPRYQAAYRSVAEVTGFAVESDPAGGQPSGPVTVRITGMEASRLAQLVRQLPSIPQSQADCIDGLGLTYQIAFGAGLVAQPKAVVEGYACDAAVTVTVSGHASSWRRDATCELFQAVRQILPVQAKATQTFAIGCAG